MKAGLSAAFANAATRRDPTSGEISGGFPCGPADIELFDELFFRSTQLGIELTAILTAAGITPSDGSLNQVLTALDILYGHGRLLNTRYFTTPGTSTYTPTTGTAYIEVEVQGGGGGGGGAPATSTGESSCGGYGSSGNYARKLITSSFSGVTVTVGAAGSVSAGGSGGTGGTSSFGALVSATGGGGASVAGPSAATSQIASGGSTPTAGASGDINIAGIAGAAYQIAASQGVPSVIAPAMFSGGFGAGGAGTANPPSTSAKTGGAGRPGIVVVREYA